MVGRFCPESPPGFVRLVATSAVSPDPLSGEPRPGCGYRGPCSAASKTGDWETPAGAGPGAGAKKIYSNQTTVVTVSSNSSQSTSAAPSPANATTKAAGGALQSTASIFVVSLSLLHLYC
uniref:CD24 molecule n=1 Tax=Aotus nancymaae TaxID=37293 RepID=A0A2K5F687_AOTNA